MIGAANILYKFDLRAYIQPYMQTRIISITGSTMRIIVMQAYFHKMISCPLSCCIDYRLPYRIFFHSRRKCFDLEHTFMNTTIVVQKRLKQLRLYSIETVIYIPAKTKDDNDVLDLKRWLLKDRQYRFEFSRLDIYYQQFRFSRELKR
jgi:hypothetical protein